MIDAYSRDDRRLAVRRAHAHRPRPRRAADGARAAAAPAPTSSSSTTATPAASTPRIDYSQTLDDHGVLASIGSVGDAYDNALAESFVDSFKTELIRDRVWRTRTQLELAIVEYVAWFNTDRLHSALGDIPPAEYDGASCTDARVHRTARSIEKRKPIKTVPAKPGTAQGKAPTGQLQRESIHHRSRTYTASARLLRPHGARRSARLQAPDHRCPGLPAPCRSAGRQVHASSPPTWRPARRQLQDPVGCGMASRNLPVSQHRMRRGQPEPGRRIGACSSCARTASAATGTCRRTVPTRGSAPTSARSARSVSMSGSAAPARTAAASSSGVRSGLRRSSSRIRRRPGGS